MKYLLLRSNQETYWFELDDDHYASRQMILGADDCLHISCKEDCLAEEQIFETNLEGIITKLSVQEFEDIWEHALMQYQKEWDEIKKKYPIGTEVQGVHRCAYPQGILMKGSGFIAVYTGEEPLCIGKKARYKVISYDDVNMWLIVQ